MAHPPPYNCDTSSTSIFSNYYTGSFSATVSPCGITIITVGYYERCEPQKKEIIETKKEKLDRTSKEKMLASWKTYNQKDMNIIKIKQICKPQHKISYRYKK